MSSRLAWPMTRPIAWNSSIWEVRPGIRSVSLPGRSWRGAGYAAETLPGEPWRRAAIDPWITQEEYLRNTFQSYFSERLAQSRMDAMFSGPDAPYLFYEEELYFRNDVPCGPGYDSYTVDWDSFAVTRTVDQGDFQVFEFTLSGQRTRTDGTVEEGTWTVAALRPRSSAVFHGF